MLIYGISTDDVLKKEKKKIVLGINVYALCNSLGLLLAGNLLHGKLGKLVWLVGQVSEWVSETIKVANKLQPHSKTIQGTCAGKTQETKWMRVHYSVTKKCGKSY